MANEMPMFAPKPPMPVCEERAVLARRATRLAEEVYPNPNPNP